MHFLLSCQPAMNNECVITPSDTSSKVEEISIILPWTLVAAFLGSVPNQRYYQSLHAKTRMNLASLWFVELGLLLCCFVVSKDE